jgi:multisubunit Na+/H+ antiporter MnhB subunit
MVNRHEPKKLSLRIDIMTYLMLDDLVELLGILWLFVTMYLVKIVSFIIALVGVYVFFSQYLHPNH